MTTIHVSQDTGNDSNPGTAGKPLATVMAAVGRAKPGDTINVHRSAGVYTEGVKIPTNRSGTRKDPITISSRDGAVFSPAREWDVEADYWHLEYLHFTGFDRPALSVGDNGTARGVSISDCEFRHGSGVGVLLWNVEDTTIQNCTFMDIRAREPGKDRTALVFKQSANGVLIKGCDFYDIGSDGIHVLPNGKMGSVRNILVQGCRFWITRPYGSVPWHDFSSNVGEQGIDIKHCDGPFLVRNCSFSGFQPTVDGQDASGSRGPALVVHNESQNVVLEDITVADGPIGVKVAPNRGAFVGPVSIIGLKAHNVSKPLVVRDASVKVLKL